MLETAESAVLVGDTDALTIAVGRPDQPSPPERTTPRLAAALGDLLAAVAEAAADPGALRGQRGESWLERSRAARAAVIRRSIELRTVVTALDG